jgi:hypothetical protein
MLFPHSTSAFGTRLATEEGKPWHPYGKHGNHAKYETAG